MSINLGSIRDLLLPGLRGVKGDYAQIPTRWSQIFDKGKGKYAVERTASMRFMPLAEAMTEGGPTPFDNNAGERFIYNQVHTEIGLGYSITRKAIDDNQYEGEFNPQNLGLVKSFAQTKEIIAANVLNNATTYDTSLGGDGVALCSTSHPIDGGVVANRPSVDVGLNESAIEAGLNQIRNFKDNAGLRIMAMGSALVVPIALQWQAERLVKTTLRTNTANNDVSAIYTMNGLPKGFILDEFLTSDTSWFIKTDQAGLQYYEKTPFETDMQPDFITNSLLVKGYERYSFNYWDWRAIWGSFPSN